MNEKVCDLHDAKIGDEVIYYDSLDDPGTISRVVKVAIYGRHPDGAAIWLEDHTRWTPSGRRWGSGLCQAHVILDREAFYRDREVDLRKRTMLQVREGLAGYTLPDDFACRYLNDMEVKTFISFLSKARTRQAADIIIRFARELAGG